MLMWDRISEEQNAQKHKVKMIHSFKWMWDKITKIVVTPPPLFSFTPTITNVPPHTHPLDRYCLPFIRMLLLGDEVIKKQQQKNKHIEK